MDGSPFAVKLRRQPATEQGLETPSGSAPTIHLGGFAVDRLGHIALQDDRAASLAFRWRGRLFHLAVDDPHPPNAGAEAGTEAACRLSFSARAGRVPSSALAAARRPDALRLTRGLAALLPLGWRAVLHADHGLTLSTETRLVLPADISALLIPASRLALQLAPYLDLLDAYGMDMQA